MISVNDKFITIPEGEIFTRTWKLNITKNLIPLILFHDSLGCVEMWRDFPLNLAIKLGRDVIAFDRLGHGKSRGSQLHLDHDFILFDARLYTDILLKEFQLNSVILLGHSVGAGMALTAASLFPSKVNKLICLSAQTFVEDQTLEGILTTSKKMLIENKVEKLKKFHGEKAKLIFEFWVDTWNSKAFKSWNLKLEISKIICPVLIIHGGKDEYGSFTHPQMIQEEVAKDQRHLFFIDDCGHFPHFEKPVEVINAVAHFLQE